MVYSITKESSLLRFTISLNIELVNIKISLLYIVAAIITFIKNTPFPLLFLLLSPFPNTRYSSSSITHQYNNSK